MLKIADFGLAQTLKGKADLVTDGMYRGTEEYMAPEVNASSSAYGCPADIWSLGMMFYELVFGGLIKVSMSTPRLYTTKRTQYPAVYRGSRSSTPQSELSTRQCTVVPVALRPVCSSAARWIAPW